MWPVNERFSDWFGCRERSTATIIVRYDNDFANDVARVDQSEISH
jgi:hypothetical protein